MHRKQLKEVKTETKDLEEHCNRIAVVDPSVTKRTITIRHDHEKLRRRYQLRSKQCKDVKLEKGEDTNKDKFYKGKGWREFVMVNNIKEDDTCDYSPSHNHSLLKYVL
uniref:TF-B3 domain-containing protein n=1 Tax=Solanum lycopersicum TaxID=4081 RepID=K4B4X5_SOLLC|nr:uncharacterized protein LOC104645523 [Solanum lycopersicum]XP_010315606.1 uncharacterized protein LOC104645523 [Solanum lycopersicum]